MAMILREYTEIKFNVVVIEFYFQSSIYFENIVSTDMMTIHSDLTFPALLSSTVENWLLFINPLIEIGQLSHLTI